jgi:hypothetical protein
MALDLRFMHCKLPYLCLTNKNGTESDRTSHIIETRHTRVFLQPGAYGLAIRS